MKIVRSVTELARDRNSVVTIGTFDGVHLAHQEIVREVLHRARMREGRSVVITFDPHPKEVVESGAGNVQLISTVDERIELLRAMNVDILFLINFTFEFSRSTPSEFYRNYVVDGIGVSEVVVGYDHMFGRDGEAGVQELVRIGQEFDFSVFAVHPYTVDGEIVSSSLIRKAILAGDVERARRFLGYPYSLCGIVVEGDGRGRTIGYPTANIKPGSGRKIIPGSGVYFVGVQWMQRQYFGMMNIGVRPTVTTGSERTLEVHIFDLSDALYGQSIGVTFLKRLRDEQKFTSLQELVHQLEKDKEASLRYVAEYVRK